MNCAATILCCAATLLGGTAAVHAADDVLFEERFATLDQWRPVTFPKIAEHTRYSIVVQGGDSVLKAESHASASGLLCSASFDPVAFPVMRWRWKVDNVLPRGNAARKDGDDYPIRIYVLFPYDPSAAGAVTRAKYGLARRLLGEYPPHSCLNYIWANRRHGRRLLTSTYTDRSILVVLRAGPAEAGRWVAEEVDILRDYRAAFGEDPPREARLAIMGDADNTGGHAVGYVDDIVVQAR